MPVDGLAVPRVNWGQWLGPLFGLVDEVYNLIVRRVGGVGVMAGDQVGECGSATVPVEYHPLVRQPDVEQPTDLQDVPTLAEEPDRVDQVFQQVAGDDEIQRPS